MLRTCPGRPEGKKNPSCATLVGQASARITDSLTWSLFMSLLTHRLVLLCVGAYCFIFWDLPGDVPTAPESALCGWIGVILHSLSLSRSKQQPFLDLFNGACQGMSWQHVHQPVWLEGCSTLSYQACATWSQAAGQPVGVAGSVQRVAGGKEQAEPMRGYIVAKLEPLAESCPRQSRGGRQPRFVAEREAES